MGWATSHINQLRKGVTVTVRPIGESMIPLVQSGQECTITPIKDFKELKAGDIVLCTVKGAQYLHLIKSVWNGRYQIGNNKGGVNGWIPASQIHGIFVPNNA